MVIKLMSKIRYFETWTPSPTFKRHEIHVILFIPMYKKTKQLT